MRKQASYFAPGKLFIAGEYAVTLPEGEALIMPVKKGIFVQIKARKKAQIINRQYPDESMMFAQLSDIGNPYLRLAMEVVKQLLKISNVKWRTFQLTIDSSLVAQDGKYGLGSSGALTVAIIGALLKFHHIKFTPEMLYRLAVIATIHNYQDTSFGDVACSSAGRFIHYRKFSVSMTPLIKTLSVKTLMNMPWEGLMIQPVSKPMLTPLVIYSGSSASSHQMVKATKHHVTKSWIHQSNAYIQTLLKEHDIQIIDRLNQHLELLAAQSKQKLFTPGIATIIAFAKQYGGVAKFSGAGGGDSVIAFIPKPKQSSFLTALKKAKFIVLKDMI